MLCNAWGDIRQMLWGRVSALPLLKNHPAQAHPAQAKRTDTHSLTHPTQAASTQLPADGNAGGDVALLAKELCNRSGSAVQKMWRVRVTD